MLLSYILNLWFNQTIAINDFVRQNNPQSTISHKIELFASSGDRRNIPNLSPVTETTMKTNSPQSDADDPAIYVHPEDPGRSLVITTFKKGGLGVYNLRGREMQHLNPTNIRYNNIDIAYDVEAPSQVAGETVKVDLAIASDRINDTIAIFAINPHGGAGELPGSAILTDVTSLQIPQAIFGVDDREATAYGLAAYNSVVDGKTYVFVSQSDGNQVAQLELKPELGAADEFTVNAEIVDIFEFPIPRGLTMEDALIEGMVTDRHTGILYLAQENFGIWQMNGEVTSDRQIKIFDQVKDYQPDSPLRADIEGLIIYYGEDETKYLIASSQEDSTFAVYQLGNNNNENNYVGSFAIDNVGKTDGLDITNISLGEEYPGGLLVVQDGTNKPSPNFKFIRALDAIEAIEN